MNGHLCGDYLPTPDTSTRPYLVNNSRLAGSHGGAWSLCTYPKLYGMNVDFGALVFLSTVFAPSSSLELGCGNGYYSSWLAKSGAAPAWGLEPQAMPSSIFSSESWPRQLAIDVTEPSPSVRACTDALSSAFDLVFSFEVAEHIPGDRHGAFIDFMVARANRFLVFSAHPSGSAGLGHISPRPKKHWRAEFEKRGMVYLPSLTKALMSNCRDTEGKGKNSLVFASRRAFEQNDTQLQAAIAAAAPESAVMQSIRARVAVLASPARSACPAPKDKRLVTVLGQTVPWHPKFERLGTVYLKAGELAIWPEVLLQQSACFGAPVPHQPTPSAECSPALREALPHARPHKNKQ